MKLASGLLHAIYSSYFRFLLWGERLFGPGIVSLLITPEIVLTCVRRFKYLAQLRRLRQALPVSFWRGSSPLGHYVRMSRVWTSSMAVTIFYGRLKSRAWDRRITVRGTPPHLLPEWGRRPVIIAFLHTGGYPILRYWLRAQGVPSALYAGSLPNTILQAETLRDDDDRAIGLEGVPHHFIGGNSLREAVRFLKPGRILLVALEEKDFRKQPDVYAAHELSICLNQVAFRLALLAGAMLMPASVEECGPCRFQITFGQPVPASLLHQDGLAGTNQDLLNKLWPGAEAEPTSLTWTTLEAMSPHLIADRGAWP